MYLHYKHFSLNYYLITLFSSQDPLQNSSGTDTDPTIYFVLDTCSRHKCKKRLRPNTIIEETQFSQMKNHPQSPSTSQNCMPSHVDSDGDPPLINVTHHMQTEEETDMMMTLTSIISPSYAILSLQQQVVKCQKLCVKMFMKSQVRKVSNFQTLSVKSIIYLHI